jgi:hypothetical protein
MAPSPESQVGTYTVDEQLSRGRRGGRSRFPAHTEVFSCTQTEGTC